MKTFWLFWDRQTGHGFPPGTLTMEPLLSELIYRAMLLIQHWQPVGLSDS